MNKIQVPEGQLAVDPSKLKKLADDLKNGNEIEVGSSGDVTGSEKPTINIQEGKLAVDPSKLKKLADDLKNGNEIEVGSSGDVTGSEKPTINIQEGKLAAQWYEYDRQLLKDEKEAMRNVFPQFKLGTYEDRHSRYNGCLYWQGWLKPGILDIKWDLMALYSPNHPEAQMGGSVHVYLIDPTIEKVRDALGYYPHHLINDGEGGKYLCTTRAEDMSNGRYVTSAVQTLTWAVKWLTAFELVMTGNLSEQLFNQSVGI